MRTINRLVVTFCLGLAVFGCTKKKGGYEGPTVDAFHGKVTHNQWFLVKPDSWTKPPAIIFKPD